MSTVYKPLGLRERLGYRGLVLVWFGLVFILLGISIIFDKVTPTPTLPHTLLPVQVRVALWTVAGVVALVAGIVNIWTTKLQIPGFVLLIIPVSERAFSYCYAVVAEFDRLPGETWFEGIPGNRTTGFCLYLLVTVGLLLFASWPEPAHRYSVDLQRAVRRPELLVVSEEALADLRRLDEEEHADFPLEGEPKA